MISRNKIIAVSCMLSFLPLAFVPEAQAFRSSVGAISAQNKLAEGMNEKEDLAFSPILLEMAKIIGRTGLPPGFFLQNDTSAFPNNAPGIDLRTLLLYQAGLIKMPIRLPSGRRGSSTEAQSAPTLVLPSMPEPRTGLSANTTAKDSDKDVSAKKRPATKADKLSISSEQAKDPSAQTAPAPKLSWDMSAASASESTAGGTANSHRVSADLPRLAMITRTAPVNSFTSKSPFRLWTWRSESSASLRQSLDAAASDDEYDSTFVIATTGALKSITGRSFSLASGKVLASNKGGELLLKTPVCNVTVEPGASVIVEVADTGESNNVSIYPLASSENAAVKVELNSKHEREKNISLAAGESLTVSNTQSKTSVSRKSFQVANFFEKEPIANPPASGDPEQISALTLLKKRIAESSK